MKADAWVQEVVRWHFSPATGSPFWLSYELDFDPLTEVRTVADLRKFPDVSELWRRVKPLDLIPKGRQGPFQIWESGGTTGSPKRIIDGEDRSAGLVQISAQLDAFGIPVGENWLHLGPTGPHLVGRNVERLAHLRGGLCYHVDFDPRWVKRLLSVGQDVSPYIEHLVDQAALLLADQPIGCLATTPALLEAMSRRWSLVERLRKLKGLVWFGTSFDDESLRVLRDELLPGVPVVGWYGNTMMGIACQRPLLPDEPYPAVFLPPWPRAIVEVVDEFGEQVPYHSEGRLRVHLLGYELFCPNQLERDRAVRVPPLPGSEVEGLARVRPYVAHGAAPPLEGVY